MKWTDYVQAVGSIATALALLVALWAARTTAKYAKRSVEYAQRSVQQANSFAGAQSAIAWRDQVLSLHDRGLSPGQIRYIVHLENGGAGLELGNGCIDDIVHNVPQAASTRDSALSVDSEVRACESMPLGMDNCDGPCRETLRNNGLKNFRKENPEW
jgi:hypothetical protein